MTNSQSSPWLSSYAPGVPASIPDPTGSLVDIVADSAHRFPHAPALEFFGQETTYAQLYEQIERAAEGLRRHGVSSGDRVAIVLPNCPQHIVAFYAVLRLGAIVVEHNPLYTADEMAHQFADHQADTAIVWNNAVAMVHGLPQSSAVRTLISVDVAHALPRRMRVALRLPVPAVRKKRAALTTPVSGTITWEQILSSPPLSDDAPLPTADDTAIVQYTSGTTGKPKGVVLSHRNLLANASQARAWVPTIERGNCVVYAVLPMFHAYGLTLCLTFAMSMGARLVLFPAFDPDLVLTAVKKHPPTFFPAVPPIATRLLAAARRKGVSLKGIDICISGAMPLSQELVKPWEQESEGFLVEGYGLSECSPVLMANPVADTRKAGTVGLPLPSTEVRVVDPDDPTTDVGTDQPGELIVRGPQVFREYLNDPESTRRAFVDGDWFRTGDIVTLDAEGFVTVVDRIKELIITGGFNVSPTEVEDILVAHPTVAQASVVGLPDDRRGERVVAAIVAAPGESVDAEQIRSYAREHLTPYKVPREIYPVDELPVSLIGKVLRKSVRDRLLNDGR